MARVVSRGLHGSAWNVAAASHSNCGTGQLPASYDCANAPLTTAAAPKAPTTMTRAASAGSTDLRGTALLLWHTGWHSIGENHLKRTKWQLESDSHSTRGGWTGALTPHTGNRPVPATPRSGPMRGFTLRRGGSIQLAAKCVRGVFLPVYAFRRGCGPVREKVFQLRAEVDAAGGGDRPSRRWAGSLALCASTTLVR